MKCEICGKTAMVPPEGDGVALFRVNPVGEKGIWRCEVCLTPAQRAALDPETYRLSKIIEGGPSACKSEDH